MVRSFTHVFPEPVLRKPQQQRARQTVAAVVEAAGLILVERGYAKATTNAIAERAGVSIGSLYQYFKDKDAVYAAVKRTHLAHLSPLTDSLVTGLLQPNSDIAREISLFIKALISAHETSSLLVLAIDRELSWLDPQDFGLKDARASWVTMTERLLSERAPRLPSPIAAAHLLIASVEHLSKWMAHSAPDHLERAALIDGFERMVRGLLGQNAIPLPLCLTKSKRSQR